MTLEIISKIEKRQYTGKVYNLDVEPNDTHKDDQYYVNAENGLVVHNCHPRDNIALRWLAEELNLGYDLFGAIMESREVQAKNMADFLVKQARDLRREEVPIVIVGKAYKPLVPYEDGSASMLVGHYLTEMGQSPYYFDPVIGEYPPKNLGSAVFLLAHNANITYGDQLDYVNKWYDEHNISECDEALTIAGKNGNNLIITNGSIVVDPWRQTVPTKNNNVRFVHYGNTRKTALR